MPSSTSMDMIELMGGSPVPMASGETYSSLQQGIVDGAENTELALTGDEIKARFSLVNQAWNN